MQNIIEEIAIIVKGVETLLQRGTLHAGVDVTIIKLFVQGKEDWIIVDDMSDRRCVRPRRLVEQLFRDLGKRVLVQILYLEDHAFVDAVAQEDEKIAHHFGYLPITRPIVLIVHLRWSVIIVGVILRKRVCENKFFLNQVKYI